MLLWLEIALIMQFILQPAINALLAKITESGGAAGDEAKKKKSQSSTLLRPIICICNDL